MRVGGKFSATMSSKDGENSFDFEGIYTEVKPMGLIQYELDDERKISVSFEEVGNGVKITEKFDPEKINSMEAQSSGWQSILNNFKKYTENN